MLFQDTIAEYEHLVRSFQDALKRQDLQELNVLIEYVRAEGVFYVDDHERQALLLNVIFLTSHELLKSSLAQTSEELWWFLRQFYDVLFHQVRLGEYPVDYGKQYDELTNDIKKFRFQQPEKESAVTAYNECLHFAELMQ